MRDPVLAVGDGALGFWAALGEVFPQTSAPGSKAAGIAMAQELTQAALDRWRAVNAPHLVTLVHADARFERSKLVQRHEDQQQDGWETAA